MNKTYYLITCHISYIFCIKLGIMTIARPISIGDVPRAVIICFSINLAMLSQIRTLLIVECKVYCE
jgi:hypothetical protein